MDNATLFLVMWDCHGLESVINITEYEKDTAWLMLQDRKPARSIGSIYNALMLRARYNSQRHYEIYSIWVDDSVTEEDLTEQFEENPQGMADLIRERGRKLYSDRVDQKTTKIV